MKRPYIICHMVVSVDGKVTGDFLSLPEATVPCEVYYELNRQYKKEGAAGFICGRVTMEGSFTGGYQPDLSDYTETEERSDYIPAQLSGFYAVAFDTLGKLGWHENVIVDPDGDPGYDGAQIIEVLSERADKRYLSYLREKNIGYILAGSESIDVNVALEKLKKLFGIEKLLLEGGSIINGAFLRAGCVDELSLVTAPVIGAKNDKPLFFDSEFAGFELVNTYLQNGVIVSNYRIKQ